MAVEVVDTNVWANMDKIPPQSEAERQCILACVQWGLQFNQGTEEDKIVVDSTWKILNEYRQNIRRGGLAEQYLNAILSQPITRLVLADIELDEDGYARLPEDIMIDPSDRKFVAVSLKFEPPLPIINAMDTDWDKAKVQLNSHGIELRELCSGYIQEKRKN